MANQLIKRATRGGYVKADTTGTGTWEVGKITDFDDKHIHFVSAQDGEQISIVRSEAYKATAKEYEDALPAAQEQEQEEAPEQIEPAAEGEEEEIKRRLREEGEASTEDLDRAEQLGIPLTEDSELDEEELDEGRSIVKRDYKSRYQKVKAASGKISQICGDAVSHVLAGKTLEEVYEIASRELELNIDDLYARYEHLNPGQQRMVLGNRLRAHYKKQS